MCGISSVESDFLLRQHKGKVHKHVMVQAALSCAELHRELCTFVERTKRFKNYFDANSKFPLFRAHHRRTRSPTRTMSWWLMRKSRRGVGMGENVLFTQMLVVPHFTAQEVHPKCTRDG